MDRGRVMLTRAFNGTLDKSGVKRLKEVVVVTKAADTCKIKHFCSIFHM